MTRQSSLPTVLSVAALFLASGWTPAVRAADFSWNNAAGGNWNVGDNWNPAGPPVAADNAAVSLAGTYTVALTDDRAITNLTINNATATLNHTSGTFTVGGTVALTAGTYSLFGGTISGGSITNGGGRLQLQNNNDNRLNNVAVGLGVLDFSASGARVRLQGTTGLAAGTVLDLSGDSIILAFEQTATVNNLTVNMTGPSSYMSVEGNNTLTLGPATTITHSSAGTSFFRDEFFVAGAQVVLNQGLIRNTGTGTLFISPDVFTNQSGGTVRAAAGTVTIPISSNLTNFAGNTLTGGTWEVQGTANLDFGTRNIATLAAGTSAILDGANPTFAALDGLTTNNGTLRVLGGKTFTPTAASVDNAGTLEVGAGSTLGRPIVVQPTGRLEGAGTVTGAVTVNGTITPGATATPVATLTTGNQTWAGGGVYEVSYDQLFGPFTAGTDNDLISSTGSLTVTATAANPFRIRMHHSGTELFRDRPPDVTIRIATFAGGVPSTLDPAAFQLVGDTFQGGSTFILSTQGNDVLLTFTPVPEPAEVLGVSAAGLAALGAWRRMCKSALTMTG